MGRPPAQYGITSLVGREGELTSLGSWLQDVRRGPGRVVAIIGDPGVGKTRLTEDFVEGCRSDGLTVRRHTVNPLGRTRPLGPVLDMLRSRFEISADDKPQDARRRVVKTLTELDPRLAEVSELMCDFLGLSDPGDDLGNSHRPRCPPQPSHRARRRHGPGPQRCGDRR
ncbi:MAG: AAA family ATPase [Solirubrobacteraceae bacterium]